MSTTPSPSEPLAEHRSEALAQLWAPGNLTNVEAGRRVGLCERSVKRRAADPVFLARVQHLQGALFQSVHRALVGSVDEAARVIVEIMNDKDASAQVRLMAALGVLNNALKYRTAVEVEGRIDAIDRATKDAESAGKSPKPGTFRPAVAGRVGGDAS